MLKPKKGKLQVIPEGNGSMADLSRRLNLSRGRVSQLLSEGVFGDTFHKMKNGKYVVDLEEAERLFYEYTDPQKRKQTKSPFEETEKEITKETPTIEDIESLSFLDARALKERYSAQIKKLEYEEKIGKLLLEEEVRQGAFEMYRKTRDALINIIDRVSAKLAAEKKESAVRTILEKEIRSALTHIKEHSDA